MDIVKIKNGGIKNLRCADFSGADLRDADFRGVDLRNADLRWADFSGVDLRNADLRGVDLRDADLRNADLRGVDLRDADLRWADFRDADLRWADFRDVDLRWADFRDVDLRNAILPKTDKFYFSPWGLAHIRTDYIRIGCERHSVEFWKNATAEEIDAMEDGVLEWWRENKDIVLFIAGNIAKIKKD